MAFTQRTYDYIYRDDTVKLKEILEDGIPQVILDNLLGYAIKQGKLDSIKLLIKYCANPFHYLQANNFNIKNSPNSYAIREYFKCLENNNRKS